MRFLFYLTAFLVITTAAQALTFEADMQAVKDTIYPDEIAVFSVSITNNHPATDTFTIATPEYDWILDTNEQIGMIAPGETREALIELVPKPGTASGAHAIRIKVRSANSLDFKEFTQLVTLRSLNSSNRTYVPSIFLSVDTPDTVDPREGMPVSVYLRNRNARNYEKIDVELQSDLFTKTFSTALGPIGLEGEKTTKVTIPLDPITAPGTHPLTVKVYVDGQAVNSAEAEYVIGSFDTVVRSAQTTGRFFKHTTTYTARNEGNTPVRLELTHKTSFLKALFLSSANDYDIRSADDGQQAVFEATVQPNESITVAVTENYLLLFIFAILVILSIISYYVFRSPIVAHKEATIRGGGDGVSNIKVRLFIRNRSAKAIHNLHVVDKVTSMADIVKEQQLGTLHPTKVVKKKGHGTLIRWDLDTLDAFEERIITYQVATQLQLVGDVYLPAMKVKFDQRGRERTTFSNEVNIPREG